MLTQIDFFVVILCRPLEDFYCESYGQADLGNCGPHFSALDKYKKQVKRGGVKNKRDEMQHILRVSYSNESESAQVAGIVYVLNNY